MVALTVCFDDASKETHHVASRLLADYGVRATYFIPTSWIGKTHCMNWDDVKECVELGMEIGSHTVTHWEFPSSFFDKMKRLMNNLQMEKNRLQYTKHIMTLAKRNAVAKHKGLVQPPLGDEHEIVDSKKTLEAMLHNHVYSFAYPRGAVNNTAEELIKISGYSSARTGARGLNYKRKTNLFRLKAMVYRPYTDLGTMNSWLDRAVDDDAWLIEVYHTVTNRRDLPTACPIERLEAHLKYAQRASVLIDSQQNIVNSKQFTLPNPQFIKARKS